MQLLTAVTGPPPRRQVLDLYACSLVAWQIILQQDTTRAQQHTSMLTKTVLRVRTPPGGNLPSPQNQVRSERANSTNAPVCNMTRTGLCYLVMTNSRGLPQTQTSCDSRHLHPSPNHPATMQLAPVPTRNQPTAL
jgi:hypothetical protein